MQRKSFRNFVIVVLSVFVLIFAVASLAMADRNDKKDNGRQSNPPAKTNDSRGRQQSSPPPRESKSQPAPRENRQSQPRESQPREKRQGPPRESRQNQSAPRDNSYSVPRENRRGQSAPRENSRPSTSGRIENRDNGRQNNSSGQQNGRSGYHLPQRVERPNLGSSGRNNRPTEIGGRNSEPRGLNHLPQRVERQSGHSNVPDGRGETRPGNHVPNAAVRRGNGDPAPRHQDNFGRVAGGRENRPLVRTGRAGETGRHEIRREIHGGRTVFVGGRGREFQISHGWYYSRYHRFWNEPIYPFYYEADLLLWPIILTEGIIELDGIRYTQDSIFVTARQRGTYFETEEDAAVAFKARYYDVLVNDFDSQPAETPRWMAKTIIIDGVSYPVEYNPDTPEIHRGSYGFYYQDSYNVYDLWSDDNNLQNVMKMKIYLWPGAF